MKSFKELDAIVEAIHFCELPHTHILFMGKKEKAETDAFFDQSGTSLKSTVFPNVGGEKVKSELFYYGGIAFHIIETGYEENQNQ